MPGASISVRGKSSLRPAKNRSEFC